MRASRPMTAGEKLAYGKAFFGAAAATLTVLHLVAWVFFRGMFDWNVVKFTFALLVGVTILAAAMCDGRVEIDPTDEAGA